MNNLFFSELLIATRNTGKVQEIAAHLAGLPLRLRSLREFANIAEVNETGRTFAENAQIKARSYADQTGLPTLADDSGLEVDALNGAPGIFSARYAGEAASDAERIVRLLAELARTNDRDRRAAFVCALAIADPQTTSLQIWTGRCEGRIAHTARGTNGFGYDPIFIPDGYALTFGELETDVKQRISHRAQALDAAHAFLRQQLNNDS
ncbi:MAG: XTP/dITP diphosphatase [Pyrinomonadaceae bacterium]|nr:XTP/dITP diphosphatase [Pyrinomonadaceae bacterium]